MKSKILKILSLTLSTMLLFGTLSLAAGAAEDVYTATFEIATGSGAVSIYYTQDYSVPDETDVLTAIARNGETGESDTSGSGQINFAIIPASGYSVSSVTVTSGTYKNLKGPSDTAADNTYRITKVASDLTVSVSLEECSDTETDTGSPVITFSDDSAAVTSGSSTGVSISGTDVKITGSGTYTFTGNCANGSIVVKKSVTDVTLILDNLNLTASATAPITCNKGSSVTIIAKAGSVNYLADDKYNNDDIYTDTTVYPNIENAVIKCKDGSKVIICGAGTINVNSYGKNGIKGGYDWYEEDADGNITDTLLSTASLTIKEVALNITANVNDGIKSDKELSILSGNISVSAADDAVKSDYVLNIGADGTEGPVIKVNKSTEGIEAATLNIYSGNITVNATDDGINAANSDLSNYSFSYNQYGGYVYVNCTGGDGIDSNGTVNLKGGTAEIFSPSQGDGDPIDSDNGISLGGATVLAVGNNAMQQRISASTPYVVFGGNGSTQGGMPGNPGSGARPGRNSVESADSSQVFGFGQSSSNLVSAGQTFSIKDSSGNIIYSATAVRNASYVLFASPDMSSTETYSLVSGGSESSSSAASGEADTGSENQSGRFLSIFSRIISFLAGIINSIISFFKSFIG